MGPFSRDSESSERSNVRWCTDFSRPNVRAMANDPTTGRLKSVHQLRVAAKRSFFSHPVASGSLRTSYSVHACHRNRFIAVQQNSYEFCYLPIRNSGVVIPIARFAAFAVVAVVAASNLFAAEPAIVYRGATIHTAPGKTFPHGTLIVRGGKILGGERSTPPGFANRPTRRPRHFAASARTAARRNPPSATRFRASLPAVLR
jgi:hypothetical protein